MQLLLTPFAAMLCMTLGAQAATLVIDNKDHSGVVTTGSNSSFQYQTFTPNTGSTAAGNASNNDNIAANLPLPATVYLETTTFVRAPSGTATAGALYLDVYAYNTATNSYTAYLGSSTNAIDINAATALTDLTWSFASLALNSAQEYALVFSTTNTDDGLAFQGTSGRVAAANFGGGFVSTINNAEAANPPTITQAAFDARFEVVMNTVPEPSAVLLGAFGLLGVLRRRR